MIPTIKHSLFADQKREAKLNELGDMLRVREQHVAPGQCRQAICIVKTSTASERDTLHFEAVSDPGKTSRDIYADKGHVDGEREARLKGQGWHMHIQRKGSKDKPLSEAQERRNI